MSKKLIVVFRKPSQKEICNFKNDKEITILGINTDAIIGLQDLNIEHKTLKDYFDKKEYENLYDEVIALAKSIGDSRINNNKYTLREFLRYEAFSLWDLWEYHFAHGFYSSLALYKQFKKIILFEKPSEIIILENRDESEAIIRSIAISNHINLQIFYSTIHNRLRKTFTDSFNYFFTTNHPFINLFKKFPYIFSLFNKLKKMRDTFLKLFQFHFLPNTHQILYNDKFNKKILLFSFSGYYDFIRSLPSILAELNRDKENLVKIIRADIITRDFKQMCKKADISYMTFYDYMNENIESKKDKIIDVLLKKVKCLNLEHIFIDKFKFYGPFLEKKLSIFFRTFFSKYSLSRLVQLKLIIESIIEKEKPDIVLIQENLSAYGQLVFAVIKKKMIKSLVMLPMPHLFDYDILWNIFLRKNGKSDYVTVTNNYVKNLINKYGIPEKKIAVVGNPMFDKLLNGSIKLLKKEEVYLKLNINKTKRIFLFTSQPLPSSDKVHRFLIKIMQNFPDKHLIIKLHPVESCIRSTMAARMAKYKNITVIQNFDIWSLINASELIITISSITVLEAMVFKKPAIIISMSPYCDAINYLEPNVSFYVECGAALGVYKYQDLVPTINKVLNDKDIREELFKNMERFVTDNLGPTDGLASKRIYNLINEIMQNKRN